MKGKCFQAVLAQRAERMVEDSEKKAFWSGPGAASLNRLVSDDGSRSLIDRMSASVECAFWEAKKSGTAKSLAFRLFAELQESGELFILK